MKLIVGLGNPGKEYCNTRHNTGFEFLGFYLNRKFREVIWKKKFNGEYFDCIIDSTKVIFLKPLSYVNLSGDVVRKYIEYFNIDMNDILIISDDLDLELGNFKLKERGSSGGHNGLKSIENSIGSSNYKRLKIGISNQKSIDTKDYVLGKFNSESMKILVDLFDNLNVVLDDYFKMDFSDLMNKYNKKNR